MNIRCTKDWFPHVNIGILRGEICPHTYNWWSQICMIILYQPKLPVTSHFNSHFQEKLFILDRPEFRPDIQSPLRWLSCNNTCQHRNDMCRCVWVLIKWWTFFTPYMIPFKVALTSAMVTLGSTSSNTFLTLLWIGLDGIYFDFLPRECHCRHKAMGGLRASIEPPV